MKLLTKDIFFKNVVRKPGEIEWNLLRLRWDMKFEIPAANPYQKWSEYPPTDSHKLVQLNEHNCML